MRDPRLAAAKPSNVRLALSLIILMIIYRVVLIQLSLVEAARAATNGSIQGIDVPGSLSSPLALVVVIPLLIVGRKMMSRGNVLARNLYLTFLSIRAVLIVTRGPWNVHGAALLFLICLSVGLLLSPSSRAWFNLPRALGTA